MLKELYIYICGVMDGVLASSMVDRGFGSNYNWYLLLLRYAHSKTGWLGIIRMCPNGTTWQLADCCFSELAL